LDVVGEGEVRMMGEAKRRRGAKDERTAGDKAEASRDELWRIECHRNGTALVQRRRCIGIDTSFREVERWVRHGNA
jgi:hypothetical protein